MLLTRLLVGSILIVLTIGMLVADQYLPPWFPFLFVFVIGLSLATCRELIALLGPNRAPQIPVCYLGVLALGLANWVVHLLYPQANPWPLVVAILTGLVLTVFLYEMALFEGSGRCIERMALTLWVLIYIGLLPCFFAQLRWLPGRPGVWGSVALAPAILGPTGCDVGRQFAV